MRPAPLPILALLAACAVDPPPPPAPAWQPLLAGPALERWQPIEFGGEGRVTATPGRLVLEPGSPLTGVRWQGAPPFPESGYELELSATRRSGTDFFCGLTFPAGASHCTLIAGGWGGSLLGLSCVDGQDAARNATGQAVGFATGQPYRLRLRVAPQSIRVWLDDDPVIDLDLRRHRVTVRADVALTVPLAIASYATTAEITGLRWRPLAASPFGMTESAGRTGG